MSPNEISLEFSKLVIFSSSESSDSESFLQEDLENCGSFITKQWEAIERTLYQEPGQQVTDPKLLKECKLWRETFPHFRVKGTKIELNQSGNEVDATDKSIQTLKKHFDLNKLEEKRENIKKKVVKGLVERLIAKYSLEKDEIANTEFNKSFKNGVQKAEIVDDISEKSSNSSTKNNINKSLRRNLKTSSAISTDKESYFERGKDANTETGQEEDYFHIAEVEQDLDEIFESWEKDCKAATKLSKGCDYKKVDNLSTKKSVPEKNFSKQISERPKPKKCAPPPNSLSDITKPFEMTTKIDKKYEGLIEKIMERKSNELDIIRNCRTSASGVNIRRCQESWEKIKKGSGFGDYLKRNEMSKLNKFNNNWLKRSETNFHLEDDFTPKNTQSTKSFSNSVRDNDQDEIDERFLEELRKEMTLIVKKPGKEIRAFEEISLQRPKPFMPAVGKTSKSSSCRDLTTKKNKETKGKSQRSGLETGKSEPYLKNNFKSKSLNSNKRCKSNAVLNSLLPPIETDERRSDCRLEENLTELITTFKSRWPVEEWKKFGLFNDDYLLKINIYWLRFPPPSPSSHYILGALYIVIMMVGIIGNFLIIIMFLRKRSLRTPSNIFIMNLAVSDALLLLKMPLFIFNSFYLGPVLGSLGCSIYGFVGGLTGTVSIMTLAAIAFDRYQVIVHPLERKTRIMIYIQISLIWFYGLFFSMIPLLDIGFNKYVPEGYLTACSFDYLSKDLPSRITIFVFFVAAWVVPICIIIGSYAAMYRVIFKGLRGRINKFSRHCKELEMRRTELKVAVMVISVISLWTLSWTPYAVVALMGVTGNEKYLTPTSSMIPALFCKTASCIDPYVYAITNPRFRNELQRDWQKTPRFQASIKTMDRKEFWTTAEETAERGKGLHRESMDEIIVLATSVKNNF